MDPWASPWASDAGGAPDTALPEPEPARIVAPIGLADDEPWGASAPPDLSVGASAWDDTPAAPAVRSESPAPLGTATGLGTLGADDIAPSMAHVSLAEPPSVPLDPGLTHLATEAAAIEENVWGDGDTIQTRIWHADTHGARADDDPQSEADSAHEPSNEGADEARPDEPAPSRDAEAYPAPGADEGPAPAPELEPEASREPEPDPGWRRVPPPAPPSTNKLTSWFSRGSGSGTSTPTTSEAPSGGILRGWRRTPQTQSPNVSAPASPKPAPRPKEAARKPPMPQSAALSELDLSWLDQKTSLPPPVRTSYDATDDAFAAFEDAPRSGTRYSDTGKYRGRRGATFDEYVIDDEPTTTHYGAHYDEYDDDDGSGSGVSAHGNELFAPELSFEVPVHARASAAAPRIGPLVDQGGGERYTSPGTTYEAAFDDLGEFASAPAAPAPKPTSAVRSGTSLLADVPPPAPESRGRPAPLAPPPPPAKARTGSGPRATQPAAPGAHASTGSGATVGGAAAASPTAGARLAMPRLGAPPSAAPRAAGPSAVRPSGTAPSGGALSSADLSFFETL
ncbi:hypothetical protein MBRA1_002643 [Malassezia brasiliensis]|uniref:Uncharacterized protein n=1 Tax=Malassezia brasiliensis TaxID=1821822 RepID=A0AAF0IPD1_9BASI|nr:hypothetical protein MBRA1_002643 [Malassezia brasiliensis]